MIALRVTVIIASVLVALAVTAVVAGAWRWSRETRELRRRLEDAREAPGPAVVDFDELDGLPAPVQRYFRAVLHDGQAMVSGVRVVHTGTFAMGDAADSWRPFTYDQVVVTRRPGFDWDARIRLFRGFSVHVHDAYVAGEGVLHGALLGLVTVVDMRDEHEIDVGEMMRFFAEAAWYPTALLPSQGVRWTAVDDHGADATLVDGPVAVTLTFRFGKDGLIETVRSEARGRAVDGTFIDTPWEGRFWNYAERGGMVVPLDGEVSWVLPAGRKPYWRGSIADIRYDFAE